MRRNILIAAGIAAAAFIGLAAAGNANAPQNARRFTLVYNVNNAGYIDVCGCKHKEVRQGSITRRASFLRQLRAAKPSILLLDGGSSLFPIEERVKDPERPEAVRKAELIVEAYNRMGYRAMAVGSFDLAAGLDALQALARKAKFEVLSANLVDKATKQPIFKPHEVFEVAGVRVGVIGLTLETMSRAYLGKVAPAAMVTDPIEAARRSVDELRGKTDVLIALSHVKQETNFDMAAKLKELNVVIDPFIEYGNPKTWIDQEAWLTVRDDSLLLRSDGQGARMGVVDISLVAPGKIVIDAKHLKELEASLTSGVATAEQKAEIDATRGKNTFEFERISLEPHHRTDPDIDRLIEEWKKNIDPSKVAHLDAELPRKGDFQTVARCKECHPKQYDNWTKTKHSHAMASLAETGDQHRYDCVGCHSLGYGEAFLDTSKIGAFADVQCESCHGTNTKHSEDPKQFKFARVARSDCIVCHNKEQTRAEFDYVSAKAKVQCPKG